MKCAHCMQNFHSRTQVVLLGSDQDGGWAILKDLCPACSRLVLRLASCHVRKAPDGRETVGSVVSETLVRPKGSQRPPAPPDVPKDLANDYAEACLVFPDSPKASAALSRRCLQHLLREKAGVKPGNLADEIQQVLDSRQLPSLLAESLDAIRNIGNFAAHPIKSQATGEILEVETGEAEWNLDVLESLFDFYFTQPSLLDRKRDALNAKLKEAGKPGMK